MSDKNKEAIQQQENLSSDVIAFCALFARIMMRCLREKIHMSEDYSPYHLRQRNEKQEEPMMQPDRSEPPKRAAIYARSYQLKQLGGTSSIQAQIDLCKAYCTEHGYMLSEDQMYYEVREGTVETDHPSD